MSSETRRKKRGIRRSSDIRSILRTGKMIQTKWFRLFYRESATGYVRFGVIVGKKLGSAVHRNRAKRRFRELLRRETASLSSGLDLILVPKSASLDENTQTLQTALHRSLNPQREHSTEQSK